MGCACVGCGACANTAPPLQGRFISELTPGWENIQILVDGQDMTRYVFDVDSERGLAWAYEHDEDGQVPLYVHPRLVLLQGKIELRERPVEAAAE
jgi:hypothetical protein